VTGYSFKTFDPATGTATAFLPDISSASCSLEFSDVGSLKLSYPKLGRNFAALDTDRVEVGVFYNGVEIDDGRFTMDSDEIDEVDFTGIADFNGRSLLNLLDYCIIYPLSGTSVATSQTFASQTAGAILRAIFLQNSNRGGQMASITWASFSNTTDSNGAAWAATIGNIEYKVGTSYLDIVRNLVDNGMIEVKMIGRDLRVYNAGTMGVDRTITSPPVVLRKGKELLEAPTTSTSEQIAGVALIEGDDAILIENSNSTVNAAWGRRETYISQGGISDTTTLGVLSAQELTRRSAVRRQKTRKLDIRASGLEPNVDYRVSDYIFSDTTGVNERLRVRQLVIELDNNNIKSASIVLNDKFLEQEIAIARKVAGILGGATAAGSVAVPADPDPTVGADTTIPSQVTGLSWSSAAYQLPNGQTESQITATWTNVTTNTNATVIDDFDFYEVQAKRASSSDWPNLGTTRSDTNTAYMQVPSNVTADVRVRAVDQNGNKGAWSTTSTGTTAADATAPPVPSTPVVTPYLGQLRIFWDGLGSVGEAMPTDFKYTEVHMSTTTGFTPSSTTLVDQLSAKGYSVQTDLTYGTPYYVKFRSVDRSNNISAASTQATASPETVTGLDIAALTIATSNMADLAISTAKIADAAIINAKIANLAVDDAKIGNMNVGKLVAGTLTADITVSARIKTANTGARVELNSSGLQAYNSSNVQTVNVAASTGSATITGSFQTDFATSTTPHILMQNSGDRTTIFFYDNSGAGTNYAFMNTPLDSNNVPRVGINSGLFTMLGDPTVRSKLFLNNLSGIQLESSGTNGRLGFGLDMRDTYMSLQRTSSVGNLTGGSFEATDTTFNIRRYGGGILNGGQIAADTNSLYLDANASGSLTARIQLDDNQSIWLKGRFKQDNPDSGVSALYTGVWNVVNISGGATVNYGVTMATTPRVLFMINNGSGTSPGAHWVFAQGATSFTIQNAVSMNVNVTYWCIRLI